MTPSTIATERASVDLAPTLGGCITRFVSRGPCCDVHIMRPTSAAALETGDPRGFACFALVPYSGRIRGGRFRFGGAQVREPLNFLPERHTIHGHGWQAPWQVLEQTASSLAMAYEHESGDWPYPYRATQQLSLNDGREHAVHTSLTVALGLENLGRKPMPAGLGLHPYFSRTPRARVRAVVDGVWETDDEVMPVARAPLPSHADLSSGIDVDAVALDNAFTGFDGVAHVEWPEQHVALRITASPLMGHLVVFTPPGEDYFCVEPVSHCTDAFNLAASGRLDTGMIVLEPAQRVTAEVRFDVLAA